MPTTKLRMSSFADESKIWWPASQSPRYRATRRSFSPSIYNHKTNHPEGFIKKILRRGIHELHRPEVYSLQKLQFQFHLRGCLAYHSTQERRAIQYKTCESLRWKQLLLMCPPTVTSKDANQQSTVLCTILRENKTNSFHDYLADMVFNPQILGHTLMPETCKCILLSRLLQFYVT